MNVLCKIFGHKFSARDKKIFNYLTDKFIGLDTTISGLGLHIIPRWIKCIRRNCDYKIDAEVWLKSVMLFRETKVGKTTFVELASQIKKLGK